MIRFFSVVLFLSFISISQAHSADKWLVNVNVAELSAGYKEGYLLVSFNTEGGSSVFTNPKNCARVSGNFFIVDPNNANVDHIYPMLLAAKTAQQPVSIAIDANHCGTSGFEHGQSRPSIARVKL
ncbi:hypothetical protein [Pseudoalteromonas luteoviolacea]|uniref:Uncharacterized protein n=1 Tax=Pseudoalteromonas luteoviolacea (strain 2ta16) TaxID=1353533 RepID=V4H0C0_PSEL2|nr:hypothetical protein [Pseudoalteromonas luteoviolacea]ESP90851.1 hypothetical protein PL2TA16_01242 [Pseudoalteromonas luteoviolacea 2ta16]KZN38391.1 hypothetical protein N483_20760 [Pseudoalteromonas luteoviolacea NCIMB 1944]